MASSKAPASLHLASTGDSSMKEALRVCLELFLQNQVLGKRLATGQQKNIRSALSKPSLSARCASMAASSLPLITIGKGLAGQTRGHGGVDDLATGFSWLATAALVSGEFFMRVFLQWRESGWPFQQPPEHSLIPSVEFVPRPGHHSTLPGSECRFGDGRAGVQLNFHYGATGIIGYDLEVIGLARTVCSYGTHHHQRRRVPPQQRHPFMGANGTNINGVVTMGSAHESRTTKPAR